jgi:polysaccharide deacetylase family protein (PEP-CTERM system associated)
MSRSFPNDIVNAFCIDLEEWFHVCATGTPYDDPKTWETAETCIVKDTDVILRLLDQAKTRATFLAVGWLAEHRPELIKRISEAGHEIGCHTHFHRLVYTLTPEEFESDLIRALGALREVSGQPVAVFRAPWFSIKRSCFWAYPIMRRHGVMVDVSIVPARRGNGGIDGFARDPFLLHTHEGAMKVFPMSIMTAFGQRIQFSGGGYLRLFAMPIVHYGFRQNHRAGRPVMTYVHPREVNPQHPRVRLSRLQSFKCYVNTKTTEDKLRQLLKSYRFGTVADALAQIKSYAEYDSVNDDIVPVHQAAHASRAAGRR